jgi:hypothetical protein
VGGKRLRPTGVVCLRQAGATLYIEEHVEFSRQTGQIVRAERRYQIVRILLSVGTSYDLCAAHIFGLTGDWQDTNIVVMQGLILLQMGRYSTAPPADVLVKYRPQKTGVSR